jgi:hypothetical protein
MESDLNVAEHGQLDATRDRVLPRHSVAVTV